VIIHKLNRKQIDPVKWDLCICQSNNPKIFATYDFLEKSFCEWEGFVGIIDDTYVVVVPVQIRRVLGITYAVQSPYAKQLGVHTTRSFVDKDIGKFLQTALQEYEYIIKYTCEPAGNIVTDQNIKIISNFVLDIGIDYEAVSAGYSENRRRNLRKAKDQNQIVMEWTDLGPLLDMWKRFVVPKIKTIEAYQHQEISMLFTCLIEAGMMKILYCVHPHHGITGGVAIGVFNHTLTYHMGAASSHGLANNSMTLLLDSVIRRHACDKTTFDFNGGGITGIESFYRSFGAREQKLMVISKGNLPLSHRLIRRVVMLFKNISA
jgi:hypothetical protein